MTPQRLLRSLAVVLPFLVLSLAEPSAALGQPADAGPAELAPEARERLVQAAEDTRLAPWQRDLMLRLARAGTTAALGSSTASPPAVLGTAAVDGAWNLLSGPSRAWHSAIYDPMRDRMVVFGGYDDSGLRNDVWALSLGSTPVWTQLSPTGTPPGARYGHSAIYDPVRDRMVVFGGYDGLYLYFNDVWALSLGNTPAWNKLTPAGTPPIWRAYHSAIYDSARARMVVFGGHYWDGADRYFNDVWALSLTETPAWTKLTPAGTPPSTRREHSAIYDPVRARMVVFGGFYHYYIDGVPHPLSIYFNDVWALSLADTPAWTKVTPAGTPPNARCSHIAICDLVRDRMVVFGGYGPLNDVWALSLADTPGWTQLTPTGTPPSARAGHRAIYDPVRDHMVVFGGFDGSYLCFNDVWALSLADTPAWTELTPLGTPPIRRNRHSAIYDPLRDRMLVFGGRGSDDPFLGDVWALLLADTLAWTLLTPSGTPPIPRYGHSAIYDPVRDRMVVFGGRGNDNSFPRDVWELSLADTPVWTKLNPTGTPPNDGLSGVGGASAIYDPVRDRMLVFFNRTVWALSLGDAPAWTQLSPTGTAPSTRRDHSAIYDPVRDRMVVFGGTNGVTPRNDVWELSLADPPAWTQLSPSATPPSARAGHSAIYDLVRDRMVVFGGGNGNGTSTLNDVWALSLADTLGWTHLSPSATPPGAREDHSAIYDPERDRMVVFGGASSDGFQWRYFDDVWALGWSGNTAVGDPEARPLVSGLRPPAPNPTRGTTAVSYTLARAGRVQLGVYDVSGRLVRQLVDGERRAGVETMVWNGTAESGVGLGAGVYFIRLTGPGLRETRRVILLR